MASPICKVNTAATTNGVNVATGTTVTIALADTAGVTVWSITCASTDDATTAAAINATLTVDAVAKTATFTAPALGSACVFRSTVNGGLTNGVADSSLSTTFGVYVLTTAGHRVVAVNETTEGSASFGWTKPFNALVRSLAAPVSRVKSVAFGDTPYTASTAFDSYLLLATGGRITLKLPSAPSTGQRFTIYDDGLAGSNRFTIDGNGKKLEADDTVEVSKGFACWVVEYDGTRWHRVGWLAGS